MTQSIFDSMRRIVIVRQINSVSILSVIRSVLTSYKEVIEEISGIVVSVFTNKFEFDLNI